MPRRLPLVLLLLTGFAHAAEKSNPAAKVDAAQVRQAVARSLPFIEKEGTAWMKERKCISCHHGPFLLWSHNEARRSGIAVDAKKLEAWTKQALELHLGNLKNLQDQKRGTVETTHLLLGQPALPPADVLKKVTPILVHVQKPEGFWKYEGQAQLRPDPEADEAATMWAIVALNAVEKSDPSYPERKARALAWARKQPLKEGNESALLRLVIEKRFGDPARVPALVKEVVARQKPDGGWAWGKEFPTDPYATGQSLYALGVAGVKGDDPAVQKAWRFLLERQKPDGSWYAPTKKTTRKDNPIAPYWGTTWAAIGLSRTLPDSKP